MTEGGWESKSAAAAVAGSSWENHWHIVQLNVSDQHEGRGRVGENANTDESRNCERYKC